jgi:hypothetical protein
LAWKPAFLGGKTVIRSGIGVYFFPSGNLTGFAGNQPGFSQTTPFCGDPKRLPHPGRHSEQSFPVGLSATPGGFEVWQLTWVSQ